MVSVVMLTYNDASFIVETLESVKAQTYNNIELIISDDKSMDNTVAVAREWVEKNGSCFRNVVFLESDNNVGVTANAIRATNAATGQWIKSIGGDNLMTPDCIAQLVAFVENRSDIELVQCGMDLIDIGGKVIGHSFKSPDPVFHDNRIMANEQYQIYLRKDPVDALALFKKKSLLADMECYDAEFRNQEDTPFSLRVLKAGHKIWYYPKHLVQRRMRPGSLSGVSDSILIPQNMIVRVEIDRKYIIPEISCSERIILRYKHRLIKMFYNSRLNNRTHFSIFIWKVLGFGANWLWKKKTDNIKNKILKDLMNR